MVQINRLPFDSPRWKTLDHAYGSAGQETTAPTLWSASDGFLNYQAIPSVITCLQWLEATPKLISGKDESFVWSNLYSSLCHQGTIYSGSLAAVPHIIHSGLKCAETQRLDVGFFLLPTLIEQARLEGQHPETPPDIVSDYHRSLPSLIDLAYFARSHPWDHHFTAVVSVALAVVQGHLDLSKCFLECAEEENAKSFLEWLYGEE